MLRRALDFEAEGERGTKRDIEDTGVGRKCDGWSEQGRCTLPIKVDCWH